jgi:hypothetical protein
MKTHVALTLFLILLSTIVLTGSHRWINPPSIITTPQCMITSKGADGVGHQLEAKISCIATAQHLGLVYVHSPMVSAEHGVNASAVEELFNIGHGHRLFNKSQMLWSQRSPLRLGRSSAECESWFSDYTFNCQTDGVTVYGGDNCWDFFWCSLNRHGVRQSWFQTTLPSLQEAIASSGLKSAWVKSKSYQASINIVMHVRRGDSGGRGVPTEWYWNVLAKLSELNRSAKHRVRYYVHSDNPNIYAEFHGSNVTIIEPYTFLCGGFYTPSNGSLELFAQQMLGSDLIVASISSLSHTLALLANRAVIYPLSDDSRPNAAELGWHVVPSSGPTQLAGFSWPVPRHMSSVFD